MSIYQYVDIAESTKKYRNAIDEIKKLAAAEIELDPPQFSDDLFILRFLLSGNSKEGDVKATAENAKKAMQWRHKHHDILARLRLGELHPSEVKLRKYNPFGIHKAAKDGSPLMIVRSGPAATSLLLEKLTPQEIKDAIIFSKEYVNGICDQESRKRGRLIRMVFINDLAGLGIFDFSKTFMQIMGEASKSMELMYPCLVGTVIIQNPPLKWIINTMMAFARLVMPENMMKKIRFCGGDTASGYMSQCLFATKNFDPMDIPTFLGGRCACAEKGGCIGGCPNNFTGKLDGNEEARMKEMKMLKFHCKLHLKQKDYRFRARVLIAGVPVLAEERKLKQEEEGGAGGSGGGEKKKQEEEGGEATQNLEKEEVNVLRPAKAPDATFTLVPFAVGPFLPPLTSTEVLEETYSVSLVVEKLGQWAKVIETKTKEESFTIKPLVASSFADKKKFSFGETGSLEIEVEAATVQRVSQVSVVDLEKHTVRGDAKYSDSSSTASAASAASS